MPVKSPYGWACEALAWTKKKYGDNRDALYMLKETHEVEEGFVADRVPARDQDATWAILKTAKIVGKTLVLPSPEATMVLPSPEATMVLPPKFRLLLESLAGRWMDEWQYENPKEYEAVLKQKCPKGFAVVKVTGGVKGVFSVTMKDKNEICKFVFK